MNLNLKHGDCIIRLSEMEDNSVAAFVCDPPYDLVGNSRNGSPQPGDLETPYGRSGPSKSKGFMGKEWDGTGIAFSQEFWGQVFRVLKPGGVVKAFGGTRTFHRMAEAMEHAGLKDIRVEAWTYGSGFPKSMNIGKAIDKQHGRMNSSVTVLKEELRKLFDASGKTRSQIDKECGFRACNYLSVPEDGKQPDPWFNVLPSPEKWETMKRVLGCESETEMDGELDEFFAEAEREIVGYRKAVPGVAFTSEGPSEIPVTAPATPESETWDGWGTALKPSWEPVCVGVK